VGHSHLQPSAVTSLSDNVMPRAGLQPSRRTRGAALGWIALVGVAVGVALMGSGLVATRSAHLEDDPDYCASCHLVEETLDSLTAGGHDEMSCLACHTTTFRDRARLGLATLVGADVSLDHPTFTNRASCASCHSGEEATSDLRTEGVAAHEAHLGSADPQVAGMACTSCHQTEDHGFTPTTSGCTASGCHAGVEVRLGAMAHEPLDCADCHALPARPEDGALVGDTAALVPTAAECLSCHDMQAQLPDAGMAGEPHGDACSWCHKPHDQSTAAEAARTCATAGCHTRPDTLVAAHRGLAPGVLEGCVGCHAPHRAHVEQQDCTACHDRAGGLLPGVTGPPPPGTPGGAPIGALSQVRGVPRAVLDAVVEIAEVLRHSPPLPDTTLDARFDHEDHVVEDCTSCHTADGSEHGQLTVQTASDCRSCHHLADDAPTCTTCHEGAEPGGSGIVRPMRLDLSVLESAAVRDVPFTHAGHAGEDCATCHTPSLTRTAEAEDCQSCHVEHHEAAETCASCHVEAPVEEHPIAQVHLGCGGAGCHTGVPAPIDDRLRDRATCLACHGELATDHYDPSAACASCHVLPPAHRGGEA